MPRWLLVSERRIPLDRWDLYERMWRDLQRCARDAEVHAWRFRAAGREDRYLEFLEALDEGGLDQTAIRAARRAIQQQVAVAETTKWQEVPSNE